MTLSDALWDTVLIFQGEKFILGKNEKVNSVPVMKSHKVTQTAARPKRNSNDVLSHAPNISHGVTQGPRGCRAHKPQEPKTITHNDEEIALVLALAGGFAIWNIFQ